MFSIGYPHCHESYKEEVSPLSGHVFIARSSVMHVLITFTEWMRSFIDVHIVYIKSQLQVDNAVICHSSTMLIEMDL